MDKIVVRNNFIQYLPSYNIIQQKSKFSYDIYKAAKNFAIMKFIVNNTKNVQ